MRARPSIVTGISALVLLGSDLLVSPGIYDTHPGRVDLTVARLLTGEHVYLGTLAEHPVHVTLDSLGNTRQRYWWGGSKTGFAVSVFVGDGGGAIVGDLARALKSRIGQTSMRDREEFEERAAATSERQPGEVVSMAVNSRGQTSFRLGYVYFVVLDSGKDPYGAHRIESVRTALPRLLATARINGVETLVLPPLGVYWKDEKPAPLSELFESILAALVSDPGTTAVCLSLYDNWPTFVLEGAVVDLREAWNRRLAQQSGGGTSLKRQRVRLPLLMLPICLFALAVRGHSLRWSQTLAVATVFYGAAIGAIKLVQSLIPIQHATVRTGLEIGGTLVVALILDALARFDPGDILKRLAGGKGTDDKPPD